MTAVQEFFNKHHDKRGRFAGSGGGFPIGAIDAHVKTLDAFVSRIDRAAAKRPGTGVRVPSRKAQDSAAELIKLLKMDVPKPTSMEEIRSVLAEAKWSVLD